MTMYTPINPKTHVTK